MVTVKLPGVNQVRARKKGGGWRIYYYHRASGERLPDDSASVEFSARLDELNRQHAHPEQSGPRPGSVAALCEHYLGSSEFRSLAAKTQKDYRRYIEVVREEWGRNPHNLVSLIDREAVLNLRDAYSETPRTANYVVSVLRLLLGFAVDRPSIYGLSHNPASRPKKLKTSGGHRPWEETEITAFRACWQPGTVERTAFELMLNTGQRGEDVAVMERSQIAGGQIAVAQEKTGAKVWIPVSRDLQDALDAWDATISARTAELHARNKPVPLAFARHVLVTERYGKSFTVDNFRHTMIDAYAATPGIQGGMSSGGVTSHGLRYTAATILKELGCSWEEIASITGHETAQMVKKYTTQKRRAKLAISRLDKARK